MPADVPRSPFPTFYGPNERPAARGEGERGEAARRTRARMSGVGAADLSTKSQVGRLVRAASTRPMRLPPPRPGLPLTPAPVRTDPEAG